MHHSDPTKEAHKPSAVSDYPEEVSDVTVALSAAKVRHVILN